MAVKIQLRRDTAANWASVDPIIADGEIVIESDTDQFKLGNGVDLYSVLPYGGIIGPAQTNSLANFGTGQDGNLNLSAGTVTLTRDMFYDVITISATGKIVTNGFKLFCNTLDLSNTNASSIVPTAIPDGSSSATQTGAAGGIASILGTLSPSVAGGAGATGVVGVGAVAAIPTATSPSNGGSGGAGGAGGAGGSGAGGILRAGGVASIRHAIACYVESLLRGIVNLQAGAAAAGGSSGAGDGVNLGRGGGGGGVGNAPIMIFARNVITSASTQAACINSRGGNGGNGATATVGNVGGGGAGGGGGGGYIYLAYEQKTGPAIAGLLDCSGGAGGIGGNGFGTGIGGSGGSGGEGGRIQLYRTIDSTGSETIGAAGTLGSLGAGVTGGAGGTGGACATTL